jgi:hypothetical protein
MNFWDFLDRNIKIIVIGIVILAYFALIAISNH